MRVGNTSRNTPFLSALLAVALAIGAPIALLILVTRWGDSPQRQIIGFIGILALGSCLLFRRKYELLLLMMLFASQFRVSLYSILLDPPAALQLFLTDILLILFFVAAIERGERLRPDKVGWLFACLIGWQLLSTIAASAHVDRSLVFILWQAECLLVYLFVRNLQLTEKLANNIKLVIMLVIGLQGILALVQQATDGTIGLVILGEQDRSRLFYVLGDLRVSGTLGATNALAGYMAMLLVCALPFLFKRRGYLWYAVYGVGAAALLFTLSRAGWLSFVVGSGLVIVGLIRAGLIRATRLLFIAALGVGALAVGVSLYFDKVQERFQDRAAIASAAGRFNQIEEAWPIIKKYPVFGIGPGVTEYFGAWKNYSRYVSPNLLGVRLSNQPHSSQLQYWVESGTPGFAMFMGIFALTISTALKRSTAVAGATDISLLQIGAAAGAAAAMIHASFGTEINSYQISLVFWILLGIARNRSVSVGRVGIDIIQRPTDYLWRQTIESGPPLLGRGRK